MEKLRKYYETLGIKPGASLDEIKQAYRDSVSVWHPDRFANNDRLQQKAQEKIKEINEAYEKLNAFFRDYGNPNFSDTNNTTENSYQNKTSNNNSQPPPNANPKPPPDSNSKTRPDESQESKHNTNKSVNRRQIYEAVIGKNIDYYLPIFERFDRDGKTSVSWNWSAFFCGGLWCLHRKMNLVGFLYIIVSMVLGVFEKVDTQGVLAIPLFLMYSALSFCLGMYANTFYYNHINKKISGLHLNMQNASSLESLGKMFKPNKAVLYVLSGFVGLAIIGIIAAIAIPQLKSEVPTPATKSDVFDQLAAAAPASTSATEAPPQGMKTYTITHPVTGRVIEITSSTLPTEAEIDKAFASTASTKLTPVDFDPFSKAAQPGTGFIIGKDFVTDTRTGLMWARNGNIADKEMSWDNAMRWVKNLKYGGYSDWRLPSKEELDYFAKQGGARPSEWFNANGFDNVQASYYWSGSTGTNDANYAWFVTMSASGLGNFVKNTDLFVWPIRGRRIN